MVYLTDVKGLSYRQIAGLTGIPVGARVQASQAAGMNAVVAARENRLLAMVATFSRKSAASIRRHAVRSSAGVFGSPSA